MNNIFREGDAENLEGKCEEEMGYRGVMCAACIDKYVKKGNFSCSKCPSNVAVSYVIIIISIIILTGGVAFLVRSSINARVKGGHSIYIKILLNHMTVLSLLNLFDLQWPDEVAYIYIIYIYILYIIM